jgi:hypothetical protein
MEKRENELICLNICPHCSAIEIGLYNPFMVSKKLEDSQVTMTTKHLIAASSESHATTIYSGGR